MKQIVKRIFAPGAAIQQWFVPRSDDPDLVFREKTLRLFLGVIIPFGVLIFAASFSWYGEIPLDQPQRFNWYDLLVQYGWSILILITLALMVMSAILLHKGDVTRSGNMLSFAFIAFSTMVLFVDTYRSTLVQPAFMTAILVCYTLLPKSRLLQVTGVIFAIIAGIIITHYTMGVSGYANIGFTWDENSDPITGRISWAGAMLNLFTPLLGESLILYIFRQEIDSRYAAVVDSKRKAELIHQAEIAAQRAQASNEAKTEFISILSHEIRTPLQAIISSADFMLRPEFNTTSLPDEYLPDVKQIQMYSRHLVTIATSVLDLNKMEAGKFELHITPINPATLIEAAELFAQGIVPPDVALEVCCPSDLPLIQADETRIKQVLFNLVSNACKFTKKGSITIEAHIEGKTCVFSVADTGIGIPPEAQTKLFTPFTQVKQTLTREYVGSGMGLAISKRLVELHGGSIGMESTPDVGTTIHFTIPIG